MDKENKYIHIHIIEQTIRENRNALDTVRHIVLQKTSTVRQLQELILQQMEETNKQLRLYRESILLDQEMLLSEYGIQDNSELIMQLC